MKGGKSNTKKADSKLAVNKKPAKVTRASKKAAKDPNKPKRPASAFFVFMEEFRKQFNKENPNNKAVSAVGKAAGAKWKSMSEAEKAPYVAKSDKRKVEYEKLMKAYNMKQAEGNTAAEEEGSEVNDDEDGDEEGSDEEDDDE
ncbi:HMG1/2-like protein [Rosa rugosa]|uniref:HMG1/2-like protein n=1 Tax=Rosa rugosa TaxID=74645 RepID=UPI002B40EA92|nr:HMG1/2-like protein [Rosa rugosa]